MLANDTDPDGDPLMTIASVTQTRPTAPSSITGGGTGLTYQPDPNYCNTQPGGIPDTFTYTLTPGGTTATVSVTVTCSDDTPVAVNDASDGRRGRSGATAIDVLANDTDVDVGPPMSDRLGHSDPANGTVVDHRRRHGPHLPPRRRLLQHPARRQPATPSPTRWRRRSSRRPSR